ncbi:F-box protein At4g09920-like [Papaver somniferum]|uniref:F-box protein At4g09920-like n=1 Tax=Papaver somniferum TaxID=3469 RepID=UPI000E701F08|nr:F-box protein At4g09920-like [Papaver somniferum]
MEKKHKISLDNSNVGVGGEDKISNLPDPLIHHIFSFLPTKCALSTCILSTRWKYLSNSIPTLDFRRWRPLVGYRNEEEMLQESKPFMNFLDRVLCLHEKPKIQKFCLSWDEHFDESRVNNWIAIVVKRKIEELFLSKGSTTPFIFPLSLFTCDSLTVLDLGMARLNVPNKVHFPRLKLLRLRHMNFVNGFSLNQLVSNCPILEELSLIHCVSLKSEVLCIANVALKNLYISYCYFEESTMKICSPNLSTISYGKYLPKDFVIDSFPSLLEADMDILSREHNGAEKFVLTKLYKKLANVKLLKGSGTFFQILSQADILLADLPAFNNLIHLEVSSAAILRRFFRFLQLWPNLESIVFAKRIGFPEDDDCWSLDPKGSLPHLKSIKFINFRGGPMELTAIKLFLKYAGFLETVTIVASPELSNHTNEQVNVMKQLLEFPRLANCVVKFLMSYENA